MANTTGRRVAPVKRTSTIRKPLPQHEPAHQEVHEAQVIELQPHTIDDDDGGSALDSVLSELGGIDNGRVGVYRIERSGGLQYVATLTPDEVQGEASLLEAIRRDYGGGDYRIHVRDGSGLIANRRVSIAERKAPPADAVPNMVAGLMQSMQSQFDRVLQAMTTNQRPAVSEADAEERVLNRMKTMAEIMRPAQTMDATALMDTLSRGIELGQQMAGGGSTDTGAVMLQSMKTFEAMIRSAPRQVQPARRPQPAAPAQQVQPVAPAQVAAQVQQDEAGDEDERLAAMRTLLQVVMTGARRESDPELYAELVADQLGDEGVAELLRLPDPVGVLVQLEPDADEHRTWLQALLQALHKLQDEQRAADGDIDGQGPERADGHPGRPGRGDADAIPDAGVGA